MKKNKNSVNEKEVMQEECDEEILDADLEGAEVESDEFEDDELLILQEENAKLKMALDNEHTKYLKSHAEMENVKKRLVNEFNQKDKYKINSFALGLLPAIDNMEKVLAENNNEDGPLKEAIDMIYRQLLLSLENEGITEIEALNKPFDPNIHHAVMLESVDGLEADIVTEVLQKGYMLKDRILRASMVKVSQ